MSDEMPKTYHDHYVFAKLHEKNGRYDKALEAYSKSLEINNDYSYAWYYKALLHKKLEQYKEAILCAERALELEPSWEQHILKIVHDSNTRL